MKRKEKRKHTHKKLWPAKKVGNKLIVRKEDKGSGGQGQVPSRLTAPGKVGKWGAKTVFWRGGLGGGRVGRSGSWLPLERREAGQLCQCTSPSLSVWRHSHLLRSAGNRHARCYFDSQSGADSSTIAPCHPQTSPLHNHRRQRNYNTFNHYGFLHQNNLPSDRRQNSGVLRSLVQRQRRATSTRRPHLLKANQTPPASMPLSPKLLELRGLL